MNVIGLTGLTGAGKTTVLEVLADHGATVLDCDRLWYEMVERDPAIRHDLEAAFGQVFLPGGALDRHKLGTLVFEDPAKLQQLNAIVFHYMIIEVRRRLTVARNAGIRLFAVDAVNLLESGLGELCDVTVAVLAPESKRLSRIMSRDGIGKEQALRRIRAQKPEEYYRTHAGLLLENSGSRRELIRQTESLLAEYLQ